MTSSTIERWIIDRAVAVPPGPAHAIGDAGVGAADVVGLGAAVRHAAGTVAAMRVVVEDLVARHGFRALALEGTDAPFATAAALDRFLVDGDGDPRAIVAAGQGFLHSREILDLVLALRARNVEHPGDPVRIVHGTDPAIPPSTLAEIERRLAERDLSWRAATGQRVVHWGGAAHVIAGDPRGVAQAGPAETHRNAGGHLRAALGEGYVAVAATVGEVAAGPGRPAVPATPASFTEAALGGLSGTSWIPLRWGASAPPEVARWLDAPLRTRMIGPVHDPEHDEAHHVTAPSIRSAVDAFLHVASSASDTPLAASPE